MSYKFEKWILRPALERPGPNKYFYEIFYSEKWVRDLLVVGTVIATSFFLFRYFFAWKIGPEIILGYTFAALAYLPNMAGILIVLGRRTVFLFHIYYLVVIGGTMYGTFHIYQAVGATIATIFSLIVIGATIAGFMEIHDRQERWHREERAEERRRKLSP